MSRHDALRAENLLETVRDFTAEYGHPPSIRDLLPRVGLASTSAVHHHVKKLIREGRLRYCECGCRRVFAERSGPGVAYFTGTDTPESVERKMADAFQPVSSIVAAFERYMGDDR